MAEKTLLAGGALGAIAGAVVGFLIARLLSRIARSGNPAAHRT
jgi:gas vesicle protein